MQQTRKSRIYTLQNHKVQTFIYSQFYAATVSANLRRLLVDLKNIVQNYEEF